MHAFWILAAACISATPPPTNDFDILDDAALDDLLGFGEHQQFETNNNGQFAFDQQQPSHQQHHSQESDFPLASVSADLSGNRDDLVDKEEEMFLQQLDHIVAPHNAHDLSMIDVRHFDLIDHPEKRKKDERLVSHKIVFANSHVSDALLRPAKRPRLSLEAHASSDQTLAHFQRTEATVAENLSILLKNAVQFPQYNPNLIKTLMSKMTIYEALAFLNDLVVANDTVAALRIIPHIDPRKSPRHHNAVLHDPLYRAIENDNVDLVRSLYHEHHWKFIGRSSMKLTPLAAAAELASLDVLNYLLESGENVEDGGQLTPLCHAILKNHLVVVRKLLDHGAKVNYVVRKKSTPLTFSIPTKTKKVDPEILVLLLLAGADLEMDINKQIHDIHFKPGQNQIKLTIVHAREVQKIAYEIHRDYLQSTGAFHNFHKQVLKLLAVEEFIRYPWKYSSPDVLEAVRFEIEKFAIIYRKDRVVSSNLSNGIPPANSDLVPASEQLNGNADMVTTIENAALDPSFSRTTLMQLIAKAGILTQVKALNNIILMNNTEAALKLIPFVDLRKIPIQELNFDNDPLTKALEVDNVQITRELSETFKWVIRARNNLLKPLVRAAAEAGAINVLRYLIDEKGEDMNQIHDRYTPLAYAALNNKLDAMQFLLDSGVDVNYVHRAGLKSWTALSLALHLYNYKVQYDTVVLLLLAGSDMELQANKFDYLQVSSKGAQRNARKTAKKVAIVGCLQRAFDIQQISRLSFNESRIIGNFRDVYKQILKIPSVEGFIRNEQPSLVTCVTEIHSYFKHLSFQT